ncbi:MAG TPA: hypothetical protein VFE82_02885 [Ramlibacter sp.]|uniref:hypothetical protein n=1 Tax=Ramlibacter sp. TaxID=1917967 RepID=UPI002D6D50E2|nr:hypothetical protein [Ramlibacter sp.]HZY17395.1 hypothetical protein [Ramlibacter sp.]
MRRLVIVQGCMATCGQGEAPGKAVGLAEGVVGGAHQLSVQAGSGVGARLSA